LLESKKPKLPTLYRLRTDLTWDNVVDNWNERKTTLSAGMALTSLSFLFLLLPLSFFILSFSYKILFRRSLAFECSQVHCKFYFVPQGILEGSKEQGELLLGICKGKGDSRPVKPIELGESHRSAD